MTASKPLLSPLRYPGSKRGLAKYVAKALELNHLNPSLYVEPFVGGGSVALQLLQDSVVEGVIFMDLDPWVASFWTCVFWDTDWLVEQIESSEVSLEQWKLLKESDPKTTREKAWAGFFLNRTSFSGILEDKAGPLGGYNQVSDYKIDCRFPRATLVERVRTIGSYRDRVRAVWCTSWEDGIQKIRVQQQESKLPSTNLFFYFDPPFFQKASRLYRFYFQQNDHCKLRDFLLDLPDKWLLSYDSAEDVAELYGDAIRLGTNGTQHSHIELYYSASAVPQRRRAKEVLLSNLDRLPEEGFKLQPLPEEL